MRRKNICPLSVPKGRGLLLSEYGPDGPSHAAYVNFDGTVYSNAVGNEYVSVRPCVWIDIAAYQALS